MAKNNTGTQLTAVEVETLVLSGILKSIMEKEVDQIKEYVQERNKKENEFLRHKKEINIDIS